MNIQCVYVYSEINVGQTVESELTVRGCRDGESRIDHLEHVQVINNISTVL